MIGYLLAKAVAKAYIAPIWVIPFAVSKATKPKCRCRRRCRCQR